MPHCRAINVWLGKPRSSELKKNWQSYNTFQYQNSNKLIKVKQL
ncbi:hypothetical protein RINTHM_10060 [Richelia intracellularis HM01]|nr:hypothetical protein RINTHM_10060 [Richelia intracellularis HM01]